MFAIGVDLNRTMDFLSTLIGKDKIVREFLLVVCEDIMEASRTSVSAARMAANEGFAEFDLERILDSNLSLVDAAEGLFFARDDDDLETEKKVVDALDKVRSDLRLQFDQLKEIQEAAVAAKRIDDGTSVPDESHPAHKYDSDQASGRGRTEPEDTSDVPLG